jgi:hypothetical protein
VEKFFAVGTKPILEHAIIAQDFARQPGREDVGTDFRKAAASRKSKREAQALARRYAIAFVREDAKFDERLHLRLRPG